MFIYNNPNNNNNINYRQNYKEHGDTKNKINSISGAGVRTPKRHRKKRKNKLVRKNIVFLRSLGLKVNENN